MAQNEPLKTQELPFAKRENYIPLHTSDLVDYLAQHPALPAGQAAAFRNLADLILSIQHHQYRQRHQELIYTYSPLDPDVDRVLLSVPTDSHRRPIEDRLLEQTREVLERANYHRLSPIEIQHAVRAASQWGVRMRVNFAAMRRLELYARGSVIGKRSLRSWRNWFRKEEIELPLYQRLVVAFQVNEAHASKQFDPRRYYFRLFKNVPQQDIDMMLPATGIQMTWIDHSKIVVPSLYAAGITLWRFLRNVLLLAIFGVFKTVALVVLIILAIGFGLKSMFTYRTNTQRRYMLNMAQHLYFQNLDNNAGVLLRLLDEAEQQQACEAVLAYFVAAVLLREEPVFDLDRLDSECECLLLAATGLEVDFDVQASARMLVQLGIFSVNELGWSTVDMHTAVGLLNQQWDALFAGD